jgi:PAS domain S-box-containing protein
VLGQPLSLLMPERYREAHRRGLERVRTTGQTRIIGKRLELHGQRKDGGEFPMELSLGTWEARGEKFFGGFLRDITERKQADEALQQKSAFVRLLQIVAVAANEASTVTEAMQTCLDQVCAHTGWPLGHVYVPAADSTGELAPTSIWHPENPEHFETFRKVTEATRFAPGVGLPGRVLASGKAEWIIDVNKAPNFSRSKLAADIGVKAAFAFPVWAQTEIVAVLEFFSEEAVEPDEPLLEVMAHIGTQLGRVAERKRAETVLRRSETSLADAQRVAHLGNWDWDIVHNELRWSGEIYRIFGLASQNFGVTYKAFLASVHPDDREFVKKSVNEALYERKPYSIDHRIVLPDGSERIVHEQAEVTLDEAGKPTRMIGTVHDISERKRAEEEIQKLNVELEQRVANRTAELAATIKELEAFTYSVSHDLRAPLRHIDGFTKIVAEDYGPQLDPSAQHYLQRIRDGARHMGNLVDDLLNLSRVGRQKVNPQVTGLNSLVEEAREQLQLETGGREIEWQIGSLPFVECDPALMKQVFSNLLSNAVKYTRPRERALIHVGQRTVDGQPVVFVRDNGVGFSMKYADKLFGVFQRLHRSEDFEGTGIGLATVQRIIHKHGGRIWAEAELDKGATFYFTLGTAKNSGTEDTSTAIERR